MRDLFSAASASPDSFPSVVLCIMFRSHCRALCVKDLRSEARAACAMREQHERSMRQVLSVSHRTASSPWPRRAQSDPTILSCPGRRTLAATLHCTGTASSRSIDFPLCHLTSLFDTISSALSYPSRRPLDRILAYACALDTTPSHLRSIGAHKATLWRSRPSSRPMRLPLR